MASDPMCYEEATEKEEWQKAMVEELTSIEKNATWEYQYQGQQLEGAQAAAYYLLMMQGKEFVAAPARSWHNFNKIAQYRQLTLEEAEEQMNRRRNNATGYMRWMMKAATSGVAAFGDMKSEEVFNSDASDNNHPNKGKSMNDDTHSDKGKDDMEKEETRKNRPVSIGRSIHIDDDDDGCTIKRVYDLDDEDIERGDDWEHEEIFTDDDEAVGNDPEEREDLAPDLPAPPEINQDYEDDNNGGGGLVLQSKNDLFSHLHTPFSSREDGGLLWDDDVYLKPFMRDDELLHSFIDEGGGRHTDEGFAEGKVLLL